MPTHANQAPINGEDYSNELITKGFEGDKSSSNTLFFCSVSRAITVSPGDGDVCRCFTCDGGLTHWDPQDDPWVEHAKWFPTCAFVRQVKGDEYVNLIQQAIASTDDEVLYIDIRVFQM